MRYAVVNTKGGVGKTTTAVHLATVLARNEATLLIDGDPQGSSASWAAWRREFDHGPSPTTTVLKGKAILSEGKVLAQSFSHVVVDAGGRDSPGMRAALLLAKRAIIPVGASDLDAAAMDDLILILDEVKQFNEALDVRVLLTRIDPRTKDTQDMLAWLDEKGLQVLKTRVCERIAVRRAIGKGAIVQEFGRDEAASAEMEAFSQEVVSR